MKRYQRIVGARKMPEPLVRDLGQGPVVVLLHALLLDGSIFDHQALFLASQGYRVIVPDYAGHGFSARVAPDQTVAAMARQVFEVLVQKEITEPVILGGLSMGGYVSFAAFEAYRERIKGLMLMDTRAVPDTADEATNRRRAAELIRQAGSVGPLAATMMPRLLGKSTVKYQPQVWKSVAEILDRMDVEAACDALMALASRPDRRPMLAAIDVPTLVLVGQEDVISTPAEMAGLAQAVAGSVFSEIAGAGHLVTVEKPDAVNQSILMFLRQSF